MGVAVNVTLVPAHIEFAEGEMDTLTGKIGLMVIVIVFEIAGFPVAQFRLDVNVQVIVFPFVRPLVIKVGLLVPVFTPFTFHWYPGTDPPLDGVAVKVTEAPAQEGFEEAPMLILTGRFTVTVIVTEFDVAGLPVRQVALEVRIQVTTSPFASVLLV